MNTTMKVLMSGRSTKFDIFTMVCGILRKNIIWRCPKQARRRILTNCTENTGTTHRVSCWWISRRGRTAVGPCERGRHQSQLYESCRRTSKSCHHMIYVNMCIREHNWVRCIEKKHDFWIAFMRVTEKRRLGGVSVLCLIW